MAKPSSRPYEAADRPPHRLTATQRGLPEYGLSRVNDDRQTPMPSGNVRGQIARGHARRRISLSMVGCQWKARSSELLWVAVKRLIENELSVLAPSQSGAVQPMTTLSLQPGLSASASSAWAGARAEPVCLSVECVR